MLILLWILLSFIALKCSFLAEIWFALLFCLIEKICWVVPLMIKLSFAVLNFLTNILDILLQKLTNFLINELQSWHFSTWAWLHRLLFRCWDVIYFHLMKRSPLLVYYSNHSRLSIIDFFAKFLSRGSLLEWSFDL